MCESLRIVMTEKINADIRNEVIQRHETNFIFYRFF